MSAGYDLPSCETADKYCIQSKLDLCDLRPPTFPHWFSADKKLFFTSACSSWKSYHEICNPRKDNPPWWVAFIVLAFLIALVIFIFVLCKKKNIKWPARVSDVSLQAKQFCCKNVPEKASQRTSKVSSLENTNETFQDDEGNMYSRGNDAPLSTFGNGMGPSPTSPTIPAEPFYYVLEPPNSVSLTKVEAGGGDTVGRATPLGHPPNGVRLPPLTNLNNNGKSIPVGRAAIFNTSDGSIEIVDPNASSSNPVKATTWIHKKKKKHISGCSA